MRATVGVCDRDDSQYAAVEPKIFAAVYELLRGRDSTLFHVLAMG